MASWWYVALSLEAQGLRVAGLGGLFDLGNVPGPAKSCVTGPTALIPLVWRITAGRGGKRKSEIGKFCRSLVDYCAKRTESVSLETSHRWGPLEPPPDIASLLAPYVNYFKIREGVPADECFGVLGFGSRWLFGSIRTCRWNVSNYSGHMLERRVSEWEHTHSL